MQERNDSFEELRANLLEKLSNQGCSPITITGYRYQCNSIFKWMRRNDYDYYSEEVRNKYLQDYCAKHGENQYYTTLRAVIYRLNDILKDTRQDVHSDKDKYHHHYIKLYISTIQPTSMFRSIVDFQRLYNPPCFCGRIPFIEGC